MDDLQEENVCGVQLMQEGKASKGEVSHVEGLHQNESAPIDFKMEHKQLKAEHQADRQVRPADSQITVVVEVALFVPEVRIFFFAQADYPVAFVSGQFTAESHPLPKEIVIVACIHMIEDPIVSTLPERYE